MKRMIAAAVAGFVVTAAAVLATSLPASAHQTMLDGTYTCDADHEQYTITWTGATQNAPDGTTADAVLAITGGGGKLQPAAIHGIAQNAGYSFQQVGVPGDTRHASVTASLTWSDNYKSSAGAMIDLPGDCGVTTPPPTKPPTTPPTTPPTAKTASIDLVVTPATCKAPGSASWTGQVNAVGRPLDESVGDHTGTADAVNGATFAGGGSTVGKPYTIAPQLPSQSGDAGKPCYVAPPVVDDAAAALAVTSPTCTANGSAAWTTLTNAAGATLDQTPGAHSGVATAASGHAFADGSTTSTIGYTIAAQIPSQSTNPNGACYVRASAGLAATGSPDMTGPLFAGLGVLAAGAVLSVIALHRRRLSDR